VANQGRPVQRRIDPKTVGVRAPGRANGKGGRPGGKAPRVVVRKATARDWIGGARLRTLPLAVAPVAIGTGAAHLLSDGGWHWVRALLALAVAVFLQIGVNFANDYSDGVRGTDRNRVGPSRLTGSGAAKPRAVLTVALVFFGLGGIAGLALTVTSGYYWLLAVGAVCIVAAYFYTGGKRPYGYYGLGEVVVFVFFGLVATAGTTFTQVGSVNIESWLGGVSAGLLACAVLMVNNIRDIEQDRISGKRTLAVLVGSRTARILFTVFLTVPYLILIFFSIFYVKAPLVYFSLLSGLPAVIITLTGRTAPEFILALKLTSFTALVFGVSLGAAIAF
jgi:1,4-dihydroxy-2-naphthoate octaprenyltransferase